MRAESTEYNVGVELENAEKNLTVILLNTFERNCTMVYEEISMTVSP